MSNLETTRAVKSGSASWLGGILQRKCCCGNHTIAGGGCSECAKTKTMLQRKASSVETTDEVPTIVHQVLGSGGQPLDAATLAHMETGFGHDFSGVRVHTDSRAAESAREMNALAYTVGRNVVFGAGQFAPDTTGGRRLLAHELTHTLQQERTTGLMSCALRVGESNDIHEREAERIANQVAAAPAPRKVAHEIKHVQQNDAPGPIQRAPAEGGSPPGLRMGAVDTKSNDPNCSYQKDELARADTAKGILDDDIERGEFLGIEPDDAVVIGDFKIEDGNLRPVTGSDLRKHWIHTFDKNSMSSLEIIGFTDCVSWEQRNQSIREQRAQAVARLLPGVPSRAAEAGEYLVPNTSERGRALNRSAIIREKQKPEPPPIPNMPPTRERTIKMEEPTTNNCTPEQRRQLSIAYPVAKLMAQQAKTAVSNANKGGVTKLLLERYFGADALSHIPEIHAGFSKILDNWTNWESQFDCEKCPNDSGKITFGYVRARGGKEYGNVHVCGAAFGRRNDLQFISAIVLHELSHRLDNTNDKVDMCETDESGCSTLATEAAIDNADSYAQFAREIFNASI